jgi:hypothetical protein
MMPTTSYQPSMRSAVMHAFRASHGLRTLPFDIPSMQRLARTWVGLLVSILVLALHGAAVAWPASERPRMLMDDPGSAPRGIRLMTGMFPVLSDAGEPPVVVPTDHGLFPRHMLPLDVSDSDADPVAFAMRPAAALGEGIVYVIISSVKISATFPLTRNRANSAMVRSTMALDLETIMDRRLKRPNQ